MQRVWEQQQRRLFLLYAVAFSGQTPSRQSALSCPAFQLVALMSRDYNSSETNRNSAQNTVLVGPGIPLLHESWSIVLYMKKLIFIYVSFTLTPHNRYAVSNVSLQRDDTRPTHRHKITADLVSTRNEAFPASYLKSTTQPYDSLHRIWQTTAISIL